MNPRRAARPTLASRIGAWLGIWRETLRDAAEAAARTSGGYGWVGDSVRDWLRARADVIERAES